MTGYVFGTVHGRDAQNETGIIATPATSRSTTSSDGPSSLDSSARGSTSVVFAGSTSSSDANLSPSNAADGAIPGHCQRELPAHFYEAEPEDLISLISDMLTQLTTHNDSIPLHPSDLTRFHSRATPSISIDAYLRRIAKYTSLDKPCMLLILVYIDRICEYMPRFTICSLTVHRFVFAAVVCASKGLCDSFSTNSTCNTDRPLCARRWNFPRRAEYA